MSSGQLPWTGPQSLWVLLVPARRGEKLEYEKNREEKIKKNDSDHQSRASLAAPPVVSLKSQSSWQWPTDRPQKRLQSPLLTCPHTQSKVFGSPR